MANGWDQCMVMEVVVMNVWAPAQETACERSRPPATHGHARGCSGVFGKKLADHSKAEAQCKNSHPWQYEAVRLGVEATE